MPRIQTFAKDIQLATAGIAPHAINAELAKFAKQELAAVLASGQGSPIYDRYVNGVLDAPESSVKAPGPILYDFRWWRDIVPFALKTLVDRSPERSGRYKKSWFAMVNGVVVTDYDAIQANATVILTNNQPYSRKIEVGFMNMRVPPGVVEDSRKKVMSRFGNMVTAKTAMITLPGGYVLKGVFKRGIREFSRKKLRRDTMAGALMTYPSLILQMRE